MKRNFLMKTAFRLGVGMLAVSTFISCEKEVSDTSEFTNENSINTDTSEDFVVEQAYFDRTGTEEEIEVYGETATVEIIDGEYILQGDILVDKDELTPGAKSVGRTRNLWPNNTVYYEIQGGLPKQNRVFDAIKHWEQRTALRFVRGRGRGNYINFKKGGGCSSFVGMRGGKQDINLADGCSTGNTIHEIGHAVGLYHEQSRADRGKFVRINFNNIQSGKDHNFRSYKARGLDGREYTRELDFGSIMMYPSKAFSKNGRPTIEKLDGSSYRTQRNGLSKGDINGINIMYPGNNGGGSGTVTISGVTSSGNRYLSSEDGRGPITINRTRVGAWERFTVVRRGNKIALRGNNGRYLSSENGSGKMTCNRTAIGSWELFTAERVGNNVYALKGNNGRYVSTNSGNANQGVVCDRTRIGSRERFVIPGL